MNKYLHKLSVIVFFLLFAYQHEQAVYENNLKLKVKGNDKVKIEEKLLSIIVYQFELRIKFFSLEVFNYACHDMFFFLLLCGLVLAI